MSEHVYNLLKNHHSVRKFKKEPISEAHIKQLVEAGQSASTSSYLQAYSIIGINDPEIKQELKEVSGQPYVVENGYLFVFVMDYYRHSIINEESKHDMQTSFESAEGLLVGTIDATLVAQNIAATAEDMGYGMVYLGSLRNDVERVREILELPKHTFPLFGMALGIPEDDENGSPKPRLPFEHVFHANKYDSDKDSQREALKAYDQTVSDYYSSRTNGERTESWSNQVANFMSAKQRLDMLEQLNKSGFIKK
ncbi:oxygen-insensitive NADPH nitroreductase [Staphylococcus saprophyticus]|uniref:oxygen-insensitive NADPH nitroreductase n=1 Tax=Staphylococcus TaxID=1279 RepID=UPI00118CA3D6|nr:oxygen-insensitive NADPH nitroreductase [Staphylococcus saprophyticus]MBN6095071.1 oxygen-insensitive NADPH nitroreductase [Staphylococcus saprophyticus]MBN6096167.1 oxygen-insensitive NADPH nitroreductase [Staphylococcus saprophyticus]MBN6099402.1 oxygen-insensitive NADPH nitroreductase [Staphylococcus saprophyticus]MDW3930671.1 oxygen-insensitive NADPH nitroreductase [Staphylococcus saprophyticus]QDX06736.1 oxygen-insensitive NADPH nitroreductase [Staphylococcus saprophyticus]